MSLHSAAQIVQSAKFFAGSGINDGGRKDLVFLDFVGLCAARNSRKIGIRRRLGDCAGVQRNRFFGLAAARRKSSPIQSVLDLERVGNGAQQSSSELKPQVQA